MINVVVAYADGNTDSHEVSIIRFPDGQTSSYIKDLKPMEKVCFVEVKCRIFNNDDYMSLLQVCDIINRTGWTYDIHMPYLFAARSDRAFSDVRSVDLPVYLNPLMANMKHGTLRNILVFDAHNNFIIPEEGRIHYHKMRRVKNLGPNKIINKIIGKIGEVNIVFPDRGAILRYGKLIMERSGLGAVCGEKSRDKEGNIENVELCFAYQKSGIRNYLVVDDLCDGGRTFIEVAKGLRRTGAKIERLELYVSHGVFSNGVEPLLEYYDHIYCTNSHHEFEHEKVTQIKVI